MSEKYNLGQCFIAVFHLSNQILCQLVIVLHSLEYLTFACTLEAQSTTSTQSLKSHVEPPNNTIHSNQI